MIRLSTEVTGLAGAAVLEAVTLTDTAPLSSAEQSCRGLFCFIGADPATGWLHGVHLDRAGYIRTDVQLDPGELGPAWTVLDRVPLPFETSVPAVFAAGDVRRGSMKGWLPRSGKGQARSGPCTRPSGSASDNLVRRPAQGPGRAPLRPDQRGVPGLLSRHSRGEAP
jgi:thioredoxin reductase (NADPH)